MKRTQHGHFLVIRPVGHTGKLVQIVDSLQSPEVIDKSVLLASPEWTGLALVPGRISWTPVLVGGSLGTIVFALSSWERSGYAGVIVAGISSSIVGGFVTFVSSSFLQTAFQALHEAANAVDPTENARPRELEPLDDGEPPAGRDVPS